MMLDFDRGVIWFNRLVLTAATFVMLMIALRNLRDPIGATVPLDIELSSPTAVTAVRVGFGGFPLGFALALGACLFATRRLLTGISLVLAVVGGATIARVQGLALDGATPYNLAVLRPEIAMVTLSAIGIVLERRRRRGFPPQIAKQGLDTSSAP
jgi:fucose permease